MSPELKIIIYEEKNILKKLLELLDEQYELLINKEVIKLDKIAAEIDLVAKELATLEIKRRSITGNEASMRNLIESCDDENIIKAYEDIKYYLNMLEVQKEANNNLIKQKLLFTKKMINFIKPSKSIGTYNSLGQVGK
ncbi:flagellar export chaperone FlgN [[Clostridium] dakarense]|uniref:flagellar export chaperone FlgN n=1 Tax=Faecalimicrobium dakarense TaxID=1301100 RepID=UPI0004B0028E|nr:flagellar export chaperone FlgN [[Clostridium] dakarense]